MNIGSLGSGGPGWGSERMSLGMSVANQGPGASQQLSQLGAVGVGALGGGASAAPTPFIGCKMSLTSRVGHRYEGILESVDTEKGQLTLTFGTLLNCLHD